MHLQDSSMKKSVGKPFHSLYIDNSGIEESKTLEILDSEANVRTQKEVKLIESIHVKDLDLTIYKGEFIMVIGKVGSGKSSLLSSLLGEMVYVNSDTLNELKFMPMDNSLLSTLIQKSLSDNNGVIKVNGSLSYVQQVPWIQNQTIRDNILFGNAMNKAHYKRTIKICQLESDFELLPAGDKTQIGERGINLSGGQKARISLARAVYANKDIILMDDPISALDSNVKRLVFDQVFMQEMKNKTRILVTHAVDFIEEVDRIVIMENGSIKYIGTYEEIKHSEEIQHIIKRLAKSTNDSSDEEETTKKYSTRRISRLTDSS